MRATMYGILAQLGTVDILILKDAGEEEILEAMDKLRAELRGFEATTRQLEDQAREVLEGKQEHLPTNQVWPTIKQVMMNMMSARSGTVFISDKARALMANAASLYNQIL